MAYVIRRSVLALLLYVLVCGQLLAGSLSSGQSSSGQLLQDRELSAKATAAASKTTGLLVLGDSISAAYGIDKSLGWVTLLERRLARQCPHISVHNASVSGETTAGGLVRLPGLLARVKPGVVVIELGGNDGLRGLSPRQMQSNFEKMIALVREADATPVLLGILIPPNYGEAYQQLFEKAIVDVAREQKVPLLDFFLTGVAEHSELMQDDGLHPTADAQSQLLSNASQVLEAPLQALCATLDLSSD